MVLASLLKVSWPQIYVLFIYRNQNISSVSSSISFIINSKHFKFLFTSMGLYAINVNNITSVATMLAVTIAVTIYWV